MKIYIDKKFNKCVDKQMIQGHSLRIRHRNEKPTLTLCFFYSALNLNPSTSILILQSHPPSP